MATERETRPESPPNRPPVFRPATFEEKARRRAAWDELLKLRLEIGPIRGVTTEELLAEADD